MMTRGRGISCSRCNVKIDRYDDSINCKKCDNSYHTKCVNLSVEDFNKIHEDSSQKWYCDDCLQPNVAIVDTVELPPAEVPITKVDLVNVKNEIVNEVSSAFLNEILSLKSLILSQSKQISDLKKEIRILTKCKNTTTTTAGPDIPEVPADQNSTAESSKPDEQANLDAPNISSEIKNVTEIAENNFKENRVNTSENSSEWIVVTSKRRNNIKQAVPIADKPQVHLTSKRMVSWNDIYDMTKDVNKMWTLFSNRYRMIFEVSFPLKEISPRRNILTFRSSPDLQSKKNCWIICCNYKRIYDRAISSANRTFLSKYIENFNNKSKAVWKVLDSVSGRSRENSLPLKTEYPVDLCNNFNDFFIGESCPVGLLGTPHASYSVNSLKSNTFAEWEGMKCVFSYVYKYAQQYLIVVAISVPSECLLSKANARICETRRRLSPKHLKQLLFLGNLDVKEFFV
ncbi:hypothetical protein WA026_011865 [Henosepilachna vigintioctopunctata]|uniref:PHD-type domain-containing protein n=1 Tax=Henosepilachna vigintioctopunctata TaxID=420089 RepID=A0AAW1UC62_9CUCU